MKTKSNVWIVLQNRNFLFLWLARSISRLGDGIHEIALAWLVLQLTGSALDIGITMMVSALPHVLFGLFVGVFIDKFDRKALMILADVWRCLVILAIPLLFWFNLLEPGVIYIIAFLTTLGEVIAEPTRKAVIPNVVGIEHLDTANSLDQISTSLSSLFGLFLGGGVVALIGAANSLYLDSISFGLSAILICAVSLQGTNPIRRKVILTDTLVKLGEGIRYVMQRHVLSRLIVLLLAVNFLGTPLFILIPYYVNQVLKASSIIYGAMMTSILIGMLVGSIYVGTIKLPRGKAIAFSTLGIGVATLLFTSAYAVTSTFVEDIGLAVIMFQLVCLVGWGFGNAVGNVHLLSFLQSTVPDDKRGRIMSVTQVGAMTAMPLAYGLTGFLVESIGFLPVFCAVGVGTLGCGAWFAHNMREVELEKPLKRIVQNASILLVNNLPSFRQEVHEMIQAVPWASIVAEAKSGQEAIELVKRLHPDVVLMDIVMPGMSGIEATRRIKEIAPQTKVIAITAYDNAEFPKQSIEAGADLFIKKEELDAETLRECLEKLRMDE